MTKPKKQEKPQRKKPNETKYYHIDDEARHIDDLVRAGKFRNRQDYMRDLIRRDRLKQGQSG